MAFSERDSKVRNLLIKNIYVERGNSGACQHPLPLSSLRLQQAWGMTKMEDKQG